jgi:hypothetical protein
MPVFGNYREHTSRTREKKLEEIKKATKRIYLQGTVKQYDVLFNRLKNNWKEQQILYIGKAKYECLMHIHDEILNISLSGCDSGNVICFAQYTYIYALQQFVRFLKTVTPNDDLYRSVSDFGGQEKIIDDIDSIGSLLKELRGLANLELKYHFGNMDEFGPEFLEQLRKHYSYPNLGLGHALDYSITQLNSFPREEETGTKAAYDGAQQALK